MCGRYGFTPDKDFVDDFEIENRGETKWHPSYNSAPTSMNPIVTMNSPKTLHLALWGFLPAWAKAQNMGYSTSNAISEEIEDKPMYKHAFKEGRCLVPVSFYFEFAHMKDDPKHKVAYLFKLKKEKVFALAGLYNIWHDPKEDKDIFTYTILTTKANKTGAKVHSRMPVIVAKEDWDTWADNKHYDSVTMKKLMQPFPDSEMEHWPVSQELNNGRNNYPELIEKVPEIPVIPSKPAWEEKLEKKSSK